MIEVFKSWISSILCIGIFVTFITLILPKTKMRKYIYSLIGIVTIFTLVSPVIKFLSNDSLDGAISKATYDVSAFSSSESYEVDKYRNLGEEVVKNDFIDTLKSDITSKLLVRNVVVKDVQVFLSEDYNIEKIEVKIKRLTSGTNLEAVNKVAEYINSEYDIDYSKITVIEEE